MGDSETVVAQTSSVMEYTSAGYTSNDYNHVNPTSSSDVASLANGASGDLASAAGETNFVVPEGSNLGDHSAYNSDPNTVMQEASITLTDDGKATIGVPDASENNGNQEDTAVEASQAGGYDSSANGNGPMGNDVNGGAMVDSGMGAAEQPLEEISVTTEEERLWSIVKTNPLDFNAWTALIEETEKVAEDNITKTRKVYDAFLAEFPLCYGYWKKYADHEARLGSIEKVVDVYERAVVSVTYSVDIWLHYCVFAISTYGDPDTVRRLFERGLAYVGTDYLSYPLWDKYIEYEYSQQEWCHLAMIYTRILENPNQQLDRYFNSFKELAGSRPLSEIRTAEEATAIEASGEGVEGEVRPDGAEDTKPASAGLSEVEELEKYISIREEMYKKAKEYDSKIIGFETSIRRPYFHVRPLVGSELENWHNYLDFIERGDDFNKRWMKQSF